MSSAPLPDFRALMAAAILAPSGHNTQPWKFIRNGANLEIHPDYSRQLPAIDPHNRELFMSLGCAAENIVAAAKAQGFDAIVAVPTPQHDWLRVSFLPSSYTQSEEQWLAAIEARQSNRQPYRSKSIPPSDLSALTNTPLEAGIHLRAITSSSELAATRKAIIEANRQQMQDSTLVHELADWMRLSPQQVRQSPDGLSYATLGMPPIRFRSLARYLLRSGLQRHQLQRALDSANVFLLFSSEDATNAGWVRLGQSFERVVLLATLRGIAHSHYNQPLESAQPFDISGIKGTPGLLIRLGYANASPRAPRRPLDDVLA
jgi:hypothetical protein